VRAQTPKTTRHGFVWHWPTSTSLPMKKKLPKLSTVRNKCDALLTPIIKKMHPACYLCKRPTEVAHHHYHKSQSTRLRYELDNLVPLCNSCHVKLHHNESYWGTIVSNRMGEERFLGLIRKSHELVKADVYFYMEHYERLKAIHDRL
jgi:hypothetical protein